jgi:hypothetical protein
VFWNCWLTECKWHSKADFLSASVEHCKVFASQLLGQDRNDDAVVLARVAVGFQRLKDVADARISDLIAAQSTEITATVGLPIDATPEAPSPKHASPRPVDCEDNVTARPLLWSRFREDRSSKESEYLKLVPDSHVSFSIPAPHTHGDIIREIARQAQIPIDSLADELRHFTFSRGRTFFGYAGDEIDQIVGNYPNMRWWVVNQGLVVSVLSPNEILRKAAPTKLIEQRATRRQAVVMPILDERKWTRGKLLTLSCVGKGTLYEYLDGTREWISFKNGKALADTLGLDVKDLPDVKPRE